MKLPGLLPRQKKLRATTRRINNTATMEEEYQEPTTKLSKAFVVVLLLHVIFVLGVYSFSTINAQRQPVSEEQPTPAPTVAPIAPVTPAVPRHIDDPAPVAPVATPKPVVAPVAPPRAVATPKPADPKVEAKPKESGQTYVVVKGDTPERIARKMGVSHVELLKLNQIEDPRRLQIGQKLRIPAKKR